MGPLLPSLLPSPQHSSRWEPVPKALQLPSPDQESLGEPKVAPAKSMMLKQGRTAHLSAQDCCWAQFNLLIFIY